MTDQPTALDRIEASLVEAERLLPIAETPEQLEKIYEIVQRLGALITTLEKRTDGDEKMYCDYCGKLVEESSNDPTICLHPECDTEAHRYGA